jgi:hypothetical protein
MPDRVEKARSLKTQQRFKLFATIEEFGFEVMPCSFCSKKGWKCHMMQDISRCKECVRRGRSCDGSGVAMSSLSKVVSESQRLRQEERDTAADLARLQQEMATSLARLDRIRKQRESLVTRGAEMVNRGLQSLDELDAAERLESEAVVSAQASGAMDVIDWNSVGLSDAAFEFDLSTFPVEETPLAAECSSSGVS